MGNERSQSLCGADVLEAIRRAYPDNIVSGGATFDGESYYDAVREGVHRAMSGIKGAAMHYERPPEGRPHWEEGSNPDEDAPDWVESSASYDLVFLGLDGDEFVFEGEMIDDEAEDFDDAPGIEPPLVPSVGRIGCAVGISILAPFAVVRFTEIEWNEAGSSTAPDIQHSVFNLDFTKADLEAHYREMFLEEGVQALRSLRERISEALNRFGIRVLSEEELEALVDGLEINMELRERYGDLGVTVEYALFHHVR